MLRRLALTFLVVLLVLLCTVGGLLWTFRSQLLDFEQLQSLLTKHRVAEHLYDALKTQIASGLDSEDTDAGRDEISLDAVDPAELLDAVVTPEWVQTRLFELIESLYVWLDGDDPEFNPTIDIGQPKALLLPTLESLVERKLNQLPVCDLLSTDPQALSSGSCRPGEMTAERVLAEDEGMRHLPVILSVVPERITFRQMATGSLIDPDLVIARAEADQIELPSGWDAGLRPNRDGVERYLELNRGLREVRVAYQAVNFGFKLVAIVIVALFALLVALTFSMPVSLFRWLRGLFVALAGSYGALVLLLAFVANQLPSRLPAQSAMFSWLPDMIAEWLLLWMQSLLVYFVVFLLMAIVLALLSYRLQHPANVASKQQAT